MFMLPAQDALDRGCLRTRRDVCAPIDLCSALTTAAEVASGLAALHAEHVVHGDVNPANVLLKVWTCVCVAFVCGVCACVYVCVCASVWGHVCTCIRCVSAHLCGVISARVSGVCFCASVCGMLNL